jgi:hypothetical protein
VRNIVLWAFAALAIVFLTATSVASLIPMSWGFPVMVQNQTLSQMDMKFLNGTSAQSSNIAFPSEVTSAGSIVGQTFPTIEQLGDEDQTQMEISTMNQTASTFFSYPFLSIGGSPIPSMGML